jgi:GNAT superfamily N-acetyltransferase
MPAIEIRPATRNDLSAILALMVDIETDDQVLDLSAAEAIFERMKSYPNYTIYVTVSEGKVIGTFSLLIMDNLAHMGAPSGIVEDVVVHSSWRGQGIGKQMMQFAMLQCQKAGCYKMALSSNLIREQAHKFYDQLGFQRHGYSFIVPMIESNQ